MIIERHSLAKELPEYKDQIHQLKMDNLHFAKLNEQYEHVDNEIIRIEEGLEATSDEYIESLKKQRLALKDELHGMLVKA